MPKGYRFRQALFSKRFAQFSLALLALAIIVLVLLLSQSPPEDQILLPDRKADGFTLFPGAQSSLDPIYLIGERGFRWVTLNGRTYYGEYGDRGMFYRAKFSPENGIVVREEIRGRSHSRWNAVRKITITDESSGEVLGRAERWYNKNWKAHPDQEWSHPDEFVVTVLRKARKSPLNIVPFTVTTNDIVGVGSPVETAWSSRPPEITGCHDTLGLAKYEHRYGVRTEEWEYFSLGWMEYVYCYDDQIFIVLSDGEPRTRQFDLAWLDTAGKFRGRFTWNFSDAEMLRAPFWIESFDFTDGLISVDRRSGFRCDTETGDRNLKDDCRVRSAKIVIDTRPAERHTPVVNQRWAARLRALH